MAATSAVASTAVTSVPAVAAAMPASVKHSEVTAGPVPPMPAVLVTTDVRANGGLLAWAATSQPRPDRQDGNGDR
jgi:hypothetical protein